MVTGSFIYLCILDTFSLLLSSSAKNLRYISKQLTKIVVHKTVFVKNSLLINIAKKIITLWTQTSFVKVVL